MEDGDGLPQLAQASQNITTVVTLLQRLPMLATPEEHKTQWEICELLDRAAEQQVESSLSRWHGPELASVCPPGRMLGRRPFTRHTMAQGLATCL
jgi:hypothetical protein